LLTSASDARATVRRRLAIEMTNVWISFKQGTAGRCLTPRTLRLAEGTARHESPATASISVCRSPGAVCSPIARSTTRKRQGGRQRRGYVPYHLRMIPPA
jgi:hypothetical protein